MAFKNYIVASLLTGALLLAQDKPTPAPAAKRAGAGAPSQVDTVIQLVKGGMSEALIVKTLQRQNKPVNLSPADMLKLQNAKVSDNIISVMMDPAAAPSTPAPASAPAIAKAAVPMPSAATQATGPACAAPAGVSAAPNAQKRRLAVKAFDYSAVQTWVTFWFKSDVNIGQGIRSMLTTRMANSNNVVLLEREKLKDLETEQDLGGGNRVKKGTGAKIGNITGADAILYGDIVIFGRDDKSKGVKLGGVGGAWGRGAGGALGGLMGKEEKAVVAINLRIVDAETGEVIATAEARGESSRKSRDWGAVAGAWTGGGAGAGSASGSMDSSNFQETIIGEATSNAVDKVVAFLNEKVPTLNAKSRAVEGRVANFDGCTLYLSVGANDGVHVGDRFEIHQILKEVIDPETKEVLDKQTVKVGDFVAATVRDKVTIGQYGGQPLNPAYAKGYAARMATQ